MKHLQELLREVRSIDTERRLVAARGGGGSMQGEVIVNSYGVSVLQDEKTYEDGW